MASLQRAQTGNRVYRGVGQSPNMGQVSAKGAQGYLQREIKNRNQGGVRQPVGSDGKSDSRSGVAANALKRNSQVSGFGIHPGKGQWTPSNGGANKPKPRDMPVGNPVSVAPPAPPQVRVNDQGLLELPYSQNMSSLALEAVTGSNEELLALQQEEQAMAQEIMQGRRDADLAYKQLGEQTLNSNAASGTAFSSMYAKGVSDNATAYSNTLADLSRREADFAQQASNRRAAIQSALAQQLAQQAQEEADAANAQAGTLGYGNYQGDDHKHPDKNKNKGKDKNKGKSQVSGFGITKGKGKK